MADEPTTDPQPSETPAVPPTQVTETVTATTTAAAPAAADSEPFDPERAKRTIEQQRESERAAKAAARDEKKRADELAARVRELEAASMTEQERQDAERKAERERLTQLEAEQAQWASERKQARLELSVLKLANHEDVQAVDPDTMLKLLDTSAIEFTDAGEPDSESVLKALKALVKAKPFLKATVTASTTVTTNPSRSQATNGDTAAARRERIFGSAESIFDPQVNKAMGGGAFVTSQER